MIKDKRTAELKGLQQGRGCKKKKTTWKKRKKDKRQEKIKINTIEKDDPQN